MLNICYIVFILSVIVTTIDSLDSKICELPPKERHCIIESAAKDRWPHTERYSYDWDQKKCILIRWANHCGDAPAGTNNFASDDECTDECGGWAEKHDPETCNVAPSEFDCLVDDSSKESRPHTKRYTYKSELKKCILVRWADFCPAPAEQTNNFAAIDECTKECSELP